MSSTIPSRVVDRSTHEIADLCVVGLLRGKDGRYEKGELLVDGGRIVGRPSLGEGRSRRRLDVGNSYVLPGMVDAHVHSLSHPGEGIAVSTAAAAAGGVTTIVEMPFDLTGPINTRPRLDEKFSLAAEQACVDIALLGTAAPNGGWRQLDSIADGGAAGIKVSLFDTDPHRFPRIPEPELIEVFTAAAANGLTVCVHAESNEIIKTLIPLFRERDGKEPLAHGWSRPPLSETLGILTVLETAFHTGARVHVCHTSLPRSVDLVRRFVDDGVDATMETCPHYLLFDESDVQRQGTRLKINPPIRSVEAKEGLWERLESGTVDVVSSDHAPWPIDFKSQPNVFDNHSGVPGVETVYGLTLAAAYSRGLATFNAAVDAMTTRPAARFGLGKRKGSLEVGFDADVVVFDPSIPWVVDESALHSNAGWSPYHGSSWRGRISHVFSRGRLAYDGELRAGPGDGALVEVERSE